MKQKAQAKLFELILGAVVLTVFILVILAYINLEYSTKINELVKKNTYTYALNAYKILQSDQMFAITSKEKGYLDEYKLKSLILMYEDEQQICAYLENIIGTKVFFEITNLEKNPDMECSKENIKECGHLKLCYPESDKISAYKFDLFINIYDTLDNKIYIGKIVVGVRNG